MTKGSLNVYRYLWIAALLGGCGSPSDSFFIVQNQVPGKDCTVGADRGVFRAEGTLDVGLVGDTTPFAYRLHPLLQNDLPGLGEMGVAEPNRIQLREFRVSLALDDRVPALVELFDRLAAEAPELLAFRELSSGSVDPGGGLTASSTVVVPGELARRIRATKALDGLSHVTVVARVRAVGARRDGRIESQEFRYPVRICQGCLIADLRACPYMPTYLGNACNLAQDEPVDCCTDGSQLFCPARAGR